MAQIKIENLTFSYPLTEKPVLNHINFSVNGGEFILLCGKSGCGKTTLLKHLKKELSPHGKLSGIIKIDNKNIENISLRESAEKIGFVMQDPESQIVTDKVWHEIAFGLENLGLDQNEIRIRTAEIASYFGITEWFNAKTSELSGGQKQILNLASVLVMNPDIIILDEPTSQLDPIAAERFLFELEKINKELGKTIIITEQRLEEIIPHADRIIVMDCGEIIYDDKPCELGKKLDTLPKFLQTGVPTSIKIFNRFKDDSKCPITVREGRDWLSNKKLTDNPKKSSDLQDYIYAVELNNVCFRYDKNSKDILNDLNLKIPEKTFFSILGGNGTGKTTLAKVITGLISPHSGNIRYYNKRAKKNTKNIQFLPQNIDAVFSEKEVILDLKSVADNDHKIREITKLTRIHDLLSKHPFDLSGGEKQRVALAKVLLCNPDILIMDEPTKGMDSEFKVEFANIINEIKTDGCTVIMISHDVEFCAEHTDMCAMLFDGEIVSCAPTHDFFITNRFYTTAASRIANGIIKNVVTCEDIIKCIQENL